MKNIYIIFFLLILFSSLSCSRLNHDENSLKDENKKEEVHKEKKNEKSFIQKIWNPSWLENRPNWMRWAWRAGPGH